MFRAMRMYNPQSGGHIVEEVLGILGMFFFVLSVVFRWLIVKDNDLSGVFFVFGIAAWYCPLMILIFVKMPQGYLLEKDGIVFNCKFKKNKLLYEEIKCIIISNTTVSMRITKTPWIGIIGEQQNEILQYLINGKKRHVLTSDDIKVKLGEKIGYYHPGNIWKILKKGSSTIYNYGFWWNKKEMYKILEGFRGEYYIAASVISNYNDEFNAICKRYDIDGQRIHVIDDSTNGAFIWHY